jgi:hypothetical protein
MILAMLLAVIAQPADAGIVRRGHSLTVANEIAPAVMPYLQCVLTDERERLMGVSTGPQARAAIAHLLSDCHDARSIAESHARQMLEDSAVPETDRDHLIRSALTSIDHSRDDVAQYLDEVNARRERNASDH